MNVQRNFLKIFAPDSFGLCRRLWQYLRLIYHSENSARYNSSLLLYKNHSFSHLERVLMIWLTASDNPEKGTYAQSGDMVISEGVPCDVEHFPQQAFSRISFECVYIQDYFLVSSVVVRASLTRRPSNSIHMYSQGSLSSAI